MTDIVEVARKRRAELAAEIARLDNFLRMAAALQKYDEGGYAEPADLGLNSDAMRFLTEDPANRQTSPAASGPSQPAPAEPVEAAAEPAPATPVSSAPASGDPVSATPASAPQPVPSAPSAARPSGPSGAGTDHFDFAERAGSDEPLVLNAPMAGPPAQVDAHVGQKLRQRRWMIGMSRQQLGDAIGVELDQIRNYEMGTQHVGPSRMWQIASVLDVPMSYFFDEIGGQPETAETAKAAVLSGAEAHRLLEEAAIEPEPKRAGNAG